MQQEKYKQIADLFVEKYYETATDLFAQVLSKDPSFAILSFLNMERLQNGLAANPDAVTVTSCIDTDKVEAYIKSQEEYLSLNGSFVKLKPEAAEALKKMQTGTETEGLRKNKPETGVKRGKKGKKLTLNIPASAQAEGRAKDGSHGSPASEEPHTTVLETAPTTEETAAMIQLPVVITTPEADAKVFPTKHSYIAYINGMVAGGIAVSELRDMLIRSTLKDEGVIKSEMKKQSLRDTGSNFGLMWFIESNNNGITNTCARSLIGEGAYEKES